MTHWLRAYLIANAIAGASSYMQLRHGCVEANPLMPHQPGLNAATKAGTTTGLYFAYRWVDKQHKKVGHILTGVGIGIASADAIHNLTTRCR
jgi:hypothetical protein